MVRVMSLCLFSYHVVEFKKKMQIPVFSFIFFIRDSSKKWQEKADLLTQLESQVKRMKENFDAKEHLLLEERQKATEAHKYDADSRGVDTRMIKIQIQGSYQNRMIIIDSTYQIHGCICVWVAVFVPTFWKNLLTS